MIAPRPAGRKNEAQSGSLPGDAMKRPVTKRKAASELRPSARYLQNRRTGTTSAATWQRTSPTVETSRSASSSASFAA